jgi:hypothetical protein
LDASFQIRRMVWRDLRKEKPPHAVHMSEMGIQGKTVFRRLCLPVRIINERGNRSDDSALTIPRVEQGGGDIHDAF